MRRTAIPAPLFRESGFGLVEVVWAVAVASIVLLAVGAVAMSIGAQGRLARWDTDRGLAARRVLDATLAAGFGRIGPATRSLALGRRRYVATRTTSPVSPRLRDVGVQVSAPGYATSTFATRVAMSRPLPAAP